MGDEAFLNISKIYAGYGNKTVISDITLDIRRGETYGLIGLNGAGKTTLLKTVLGLKDAQSGTIKIDGHVAGSTPAKKCLAYLPERFDPAWFLNAYEFIDFTMSLYHVSVSRNDVDSIADKVGFNKDYLLRRGQTYSKGMRQKLGLMATFLTPSPLLILDEPMSGLDPLARAQIKGLLESARAEGRTCFLSSHILSDLEELCDRVAVLHDGVIRFVGTPAALIEKTGEKHLERAFLSHIGGDRRDAA